MKITPLSALSDNYIYIVEHKGFTLCIDPGDPEPVTSFFKGKGEGLDAILLTHHHSDHVLGAPSLKKEFSAEIYAPEEVSIDEVSFFFKDGKTETIGPFTVLPFLTKGHTMGHFCLYFPEDGALFTGDCLFALGSGRLFEGEPSDMVDSLQRIASLPRETKLYFGHEYTKTNLSFALQIEPQNEALLRRKRDFERALLEKKPLVPILLERELEENPFLRLEDPLLKKALKMEDKGAIEVYKTLRELRNEFS